MTGLIQNNLIWFVGGLITVLGLFVYGLADLMRLSFGRAWAISSVAFSESIRRRVLWITPLAIIGVVVISQLQVANDEQDAIRQSVKFCLFASGMLVTVLGMILACTNLPKEIENRVIFTIVTKPTTRLEIVIGKVIGFAKVSLAVLAIMGIFSFGYLHFRAWQLRGQIVDRLASGTVDPLSRPTDEYYASVGLLTARSLSEPQALNVYADEPKSNATSKTFYGTGDGDILLPFEATPEQLTPVGAEAPLQNGMVIRIRVGFEKTTYGETKTVQQTSNLPVGIAAPTTGPAVATGRLPAHADLQVKILDSNLNTLVDPNLINSGRPVALEDASGERVAFCPVAPDAAQKLVTSPRFYIDLLGVTGGVKYRVDTTPTADPLKSPVSLNILGNPSDQVISPIVVDPAGKGGRTATPQFRSRLGLGNQFQLRGGEPAVSPVGIYRFTDAQTSAGGRIGFELRTRLETNYSDRNDSDATRTEVQMVNRASGQRSPAAVLYPESNRTTFFQIPSEYAGDGDFDLVIRNLSEGHYVGLSTQSLTMVSSVSGFDLNFAKSLFIIWLLSLLVVIISIFCSTFLSWPIAIVLTLLLLLGHWGVVQLGDTLSPGIGNQVVTDFFGNTTSAGQAKAVSNSVEALAKILNGLGAMLPDIDSFSSIDQIEKGLIIPGSQLWQALKTLIAFGVPTMVLSYVLLKNKEVAP